METFFYLISGIVLLVNALPFIPSQHWFFRVWDFGRIQFLFLLLLLLLFSFSWLPMIPNTMVVFQILLLIFISYNCWILAPYTLIYKTENKQFNGNTTKKSISIISANVYQFNSQYHKFIDLIANVSPEIVLTMESNSDWEKGLQSLENEFPFLHKVALENTYGMHFYSKLKIVNAKTHYFVADDIPSFEIVLETSEKEFFTFFGVHPPPPSPTEEENSKERDGELLSIAKKVKESNYPVIVTGDFNNVAWAKSSVLFKKKSQLIDPRIGRGFISTFHAKYKFLRFPIDLFFHSETIVIKEFKNLPSFGSDHLPLFCEFYISEKSIENSNQDVNRDEEMIDEGKKEESNRAKNAEE